MKLPLSPLLLVALSLPASPAKADEAADKKAEIQRKKAAAEKKAFEKKAATDKVAADKAAADKAAADKAAADKAAADKAAGDKTAADKAAADKTAADKAAADKAAADKAAADKAAADKGTGGTSGTVKADPKDGKNVAKEDEKDAPLPAGDIETLRKDRDERRKATVERLRRRWGSLLAEDKGVADLKAHARRVAFLQRVRLVAEEKKDKKAIEAADELLTREDERHSKAMNSLREGALTAGSTK